ncbi:hypothetical protein, partial [Mailhella sp.]
MIVGAGCCAVKEAGGKRRVSASLVPLRASIFHFLTQYTETQKKLPKDIHFVDGKRDALIFCVL